MPSRVMGTEIFGKKILGNLKKKFGKNFDKFRGSEKFKNF